MGRGKQDCGVLVGYIIQSGSAIDKTYLTPACGGKYNPARRDRMAKLVLDLHDIYNRGYTIDTELNRIIEEAIAKKIALVEIIPGKGSGQLKKRVLRFLNQPDIKKLYHRVEKDDKNFGRIFVHFRHR
jgi:DNA-nicking Smr family endonuclease